jgi:uncharacterized Rmd1/YagE family protein
MVFDSYEKCELFNLNNLFKALKECRVQENGSIILPFGVNYFGDADVQKFGNELIGRKVHGDIWNIVNDNILTKKWQILIVLGPVGVGKVRFRIIFFSNNNNVQSMFFD